MDLAEGVTSLAGALIGAGAAIGATWWSLRRTAEESRAEARGAERSSLEALLLEVDVVEQIADSGSATSLPTQMLSAALPGIHHMDSSSKGSIVAYSGAVQRYNGRVQRLVAFGAAKRAAGQEPGAERLGSQHTDPVRDSVKGARDAIRRQLGSTRLKSGRG